MTNDHLTAKYTRVLRTILGRALTARDQVPEPRLRRAEARLTVTLPGSLRAFYRVAGIARELREHNRLFLPEELVIEQGHLVFMEENQAVVHWAVPLKAERPLDPRVWQRVNEARARWYSERMTLSEFILKNLAWQRGVELSNNGMQLTSGGLMRASRAH